MSGSTSRRRSSRAGVVVRKVRWTTMPLLLLFLVLVLPTLLPPTTTVVLVQATIFTYNMSTTTGALAVQDAFPSLPGLFGGTVEAGSFYQARIQFIRDNAYLCQDEPDAEAADDNSAKPGGKFVLPPDYKDAVYYDAGDDHLEYTSGSTDTTSSSADSSSSNISHNHSTGFIPVAILAARGYCPFFNKAVVAESLGEAVQFLIVYDNNADGEDVLVPMYSEYGVTRLRLWSVTHRTGQALKRYIASQPPEVIANGGPLIGLNALPPEGIMTVEDLQNYVLSALGMFFVFVSLTGCALAYIGRQQLGPAQLVLLNGGGGPTTMVATATAASSRRLLTPAHIQQLMDHQQQSQSDDKSSLALHSSSGAQEDEVLGAASLTTVSPHEDDCCAICMEDFVEGDCENTLTLPCAHGFHKDCVVPWLCERQSKCPLCKFDVYDYLSQLPSSPNGGGMSAGGVASSFMSAAAPWHWWRYRSWTAVDEGVAENDEVSTFNDETVTRPAVVIELA